MKEIPLEVKNLEDALTAFENDIQLLESTGAADLIILQQCLHQSRSVMGSFDQSHFMDANQAFSLQVYYQKNIRPRIYGYTLYYQFRIRIERKRTLYNFKSVVRRELKKNAKYLQKNSFLLEYLNSGNTYLDTQLFNQVGTDVDLPGIESADLTATGIRYDDIIGRYYGYELLKQHYLTILSPGMDKNTVTTTSKGTPITWTGTKASLVELIYALASIGAYNNGQLAVNEIAEHFESLYGIKLGNYYRSFQEIRIRKKSRTQFLDQLKTKLEARMDESDEHPRF